MTTIALLLSLVTSDGDTARPLGFARLTVADPEKLHGLTVVVAFITAYPTPFW